MALSPQSQLFSLVLDDLWGQVRAPAVLGLALAHVQKVVVLIENLGDCFGVAGETQRLEAGQPVDDEGELLEDGTRVRQEREHIQVVAV